MSELKYKVGDKVRIKSLDWYNENKTTEGCLVCGESHINPEMICMLGKTVTISSVEGNHYRIKEYAWNWTDEMIEGLVEEETYDFLKTDKPNRPSLNDFMDMLDNEIKLPQGYQFKDENGNVISATKIVLEKQKKEYPKTYEECCKVMGVNHTNDLDICEHCDYKTEITYYEDSLLEKIETLYRLIICRDAYWKIAGEEMGLSGSWKPDFASCKIKYAITYYNNVVSRYSEVDYNSTILVFPSEEMRDAFYNIFKEEIEICKELL